MSKRLQVILDDRELREIQRIARSRHMTVAAWVREALRAARRSVPRIDAGKKLAAIRAAVAHSYPTADIAHMLSEIERGYLPDAHQ